MEARGRFSMGLLGAIAPPPPAPFYKKLFLQFCIYFLYSCYTAIKYTLINTNLALAQLLVYNI